MLGPRGFAADIIIWDSILTPQDIEIISQQINCKNFAQSLDYTFFLLNSTHFDVESDYQDQSNFNSDNVDENFVELSNKQLQSNLCPSNFECKLNSWYETLSANTNSFSQPYDHLLKRIENGINDCIHPLKRLDLYAEASILGHIVSLYKWSMLIGFGSEVASHNCGIEDFTPMEQMYHQIDYLHQEEDNCSGYSFPTISDQIKAAFGLILATQHGYSEAFIPLSTLVSSSIGLGILSLDLTTPYGRCLIQNIIQYIPISSKYLFETNKINGKSISEHVIVSY